MEEKTNNVGDTPQKDADEKLKECERQRDEYLAGWQRAKADFLNYKKEEMGRIQDIARYANEDIVRELIGVLDSFDLGLAALEKAGPVEKGVYMIKAKLEDTLRKQGLEKMEVKIGSKFDLATSEIVGEMESDEPDMTVIEEIEPGYSLCGKIIRPVRVKVSKCKKQS